MRILATTVLGTVWALAGCGPTTVMPEKHEVVLDVAADGTTINGRYDPDDFAASEIRKMMGFVCDRSALPEFTTRMHAGIAHFSTHCAHGHPYGKNAGIDFKRLSPTSVSYTAIYAKNGALTMDYGTLDL